MEIDLLQGINLALREELDRDDRVVLLGEGIGEMGGVFGATEGLAEEFGGRRVQDLPPTDSGLLGAAVGMSLYGLRPVVEVQFADFAFAGFEQIVCEMARFRYRSGGQYTCPVVVRLPYGGGIGGGPHHSASPEAHFAHTPGLSVVVPATPRDAVGLLRSAIRSADPVLFFEPKRLYHEIVQDVGDDVTVPLGVARVVKEGRDVSVLAWGATLHQARAAAERVAERGVEVDLVDLRTLTPVDVDTVLRSIARTGRCVIVHEAPKFAGYGAELAALLAERAVLHLEAPILRVCGLDTPYPYRLEDRYLPDVDDVREAIERIARF